MANRADTKKLNPVRKEAHRQQQPQKRFKRGTTENEAPQVGQEEPLKLTKRKEVLLQQNQSLASDERVLKTIQ